ncbi:hypothetical protein LTR15_005555 [Elasticomyces elasticus]|nr:hypothetical protein LTR15_005555 [Elasticomyces elasticus]
MGGGVQWKQEPSQVLRVVTPRGSLEINVETICNASRVISEMLDPPRTELKINISSEGFGVLAHWLECGELDERCTKAGTTAGLRRLCKAYTTGQVLEIESRFLDKVLDCIILCVTARRVRSMGEENEDGERYEVDELNEFGDLSEADCESEESEESGDGGEGEDGEDSEDSEDSGLSDR